MCISVCMYICTVCMFQLCMGCIPKDPEEGIYVCMYVRVNLSVDEIYNTYNTAAAHTHTPPKNICELSAGQKKEGYKQQKYKRPH